MRNIVVFILCLAGFLAFCGYLVVGETGPMGWLNSWQAGDSGTYSRTLSGVILLLALGVLCAPLMAIWIVADESAKRRRAACPQPARPAAPAAKVPGGEPAGWRTHLAVWGVLLALIWGGTLAWHAWDWHRRLADAGSDYTPVTLGGDAASRRPDDGSHLALQGRLQWTHALSRRPTGTGTEPEAIFVPVTGPDWRPGEPVRFVAQLDRRQAFDLQRPRDPSAPLLVRVDGVVPTATRPVFKREDVPVAEDAVVIGVVASAGGQVSDAKPVFEWDSVRTYGGIATAMWAFLAIVLSLVLGIDSWKRRRRGARGTA